jgi:hypothetical protein
MIDMSEVKFGEPLLGYRFKPGDCIVNSDFANEFTQGIYTQKELDDLKLLVVEVGIDRMTQNESYGLLYYFIAGGECQRMESDSSVVAKGRCRVQF